MSSDAEGHRRERVCPGNHSVAHPAPQLRNDEYLCLSCVRHAERVLGDLPALVRDLEVTVSRQSRTYRAAGARHAPDEDWRGTSYALAPRPLPADLDAAARGRTTCELLFEWADHVAAWNRVKGLPAFTSNKPLRELVPHAVGILLQYAEWMRTNEQGPDLAYAIRCVRRDLRSLVDTRPERLYAGPCQADLDYPPELGYECRLPLYRKWGSDQIECDGHRPNTAPGEWSSSGCGQAHAADDRREWLRAEVDTRLLPLRLVWESLYVLIPGCEVTWDTAKQWTRMREQRHPVVDSTGRQRLDRRGRPMVRIIYTPARLEPQTGPDHAPLYRGSEILQLAEDKQPRRGRRRVQRADVA